MDQILRCDQAVMPCARALPLRWWSGRAVFLFLLLSGSILFIAGCAVSKTLESTPGIDISGIKAGATRQQVEAVVGGPLREWTTRTGICYRLYRYDAGIEPSAGGAGLIVFMDVITLGLFEVIEATSNSPWNVRGEKKQPLLAVSYDAQDTVIGVFRDVGEFADLPEDGRAPVAQVPAAAPPGR